ncbi:MAG: sigma-70 family RNA polymerase sigma factor [Myxococcota bacterium]
MQTEFDQFSARAKAALGFLPPDEQLRAWVEPMSALAALDPGVALACGLFHQQPEARSWFEQHVAPRVRGALQKAGASSVEVDELLQASLTRVLVENGGERLRQYRGHGTFPAFVITVALRLFTNARTATTRETSDDGLARMPAALDLERHLARSQNRAHFAEAFRAALEALPPRQRTLLKLNLVNGSSIDELAPMYQVSRATVARWLAQSRDALRAETLRRLSATTRMEGDDLEGLLASLESGFDLSLRRFITEATPARGDE